MKYIYATGLLEIKIPYYYIYDCVDSKAVVTSYGHERS